MVAVTAMSATEHMAAMVAVVGTTHLMGYTVLGRTQVGAQAEPPRGAARTLPRGCRNQTALTLDSQGSLCCCKRSRRGTSNSGRSEPPHGHHHAVNRRMATIMLLECARDHADFQYIILTPQDLSVSWFN